MNKWLDEKNVYYVYIHELKSELNKNEKDGHAVPIHWWPIVRFIDQLTEGIIRVLLWRISGICLYTLCHNTRYCSLSPRLLNIGELGE